jgi:hypothetical protein
MNDKPASSLYAALVSAQKSARTVEKDGRNKHHGYDYATTEAMIAEARACLGVAGLALVFVGRAFTPIAPSAPKDQSGKEPIGRVEIKYRLIHTSGDSLEIASSTPVVPEKGRPADKAEAAAVTSDLGYTLRGLLLLERALDGGIDTRDDRDSDRREERQSERQPEPRRDPEPPRVEPNSRPANDGAAPLLASGNGNYDPAHEAMCIEFRRRAATADEPGELVREVCAANLPKRLRDSALEVAVCRWLQLLPNAGEEFEDDPPAVNQLDAVIAVLARLKLDDDIKATVQTELRKHLERTGWNARQKAQAAQAA